MRTLFHRLRGLTPRLVAGALGLLWAASGAAAAGRREVVLYCAQDQEFAEPLLAGFARNTGIRVRPVFDSEAVKTVGIAARLLAEKGRPQCDVFWGNEELRVRQLAAAGVFRPTHGWTAFGQRTRRLAYNPKFVTPASAPASLGALTNAAWKGRVSIASPLFGTTSTHFLALRQKWGADPWARWCRALAANRPWIEEGNSQVAQRIGRGQAWVGVTDSDDVANARREGLSIEALPMTDELLRLPNTVAVTLGAPHPGEAEALYLYLQSAPVVRALVAAGGLEAEAAGGPGMDPDWAALLRDLPEATRELQQAFRP